MVLRHVKNFVTCFFCDFGFSFLKRFYNNERVMFTEKGTQRELGISTC
jgi:hypothetical protein